MQLEVARAAKPVKQCGLSYLELCRRRGVVRALEMRLKSRSQRIFIIVRRESWRRRLVGHLGYGEDLGGDRKQSNGRLRRRRALCLRRRVKCISYVCMSAA